MTRAIAFLVLICLTAHAYDPLFARVGVTLSSTNATLLNTACAWINARATNRTDTVFQVVDNRETNGAVISASWFVTTAQTNTAWRLFRFMATNQLPAGLTVSGTYHLCPCGPGTNPPPWGPCTDVSLSGFTSTNR